jgi:hypothetical protein
MGLRAALLVATTLLVFLAGCAGIEPGKRHSPAEIAAYKPDDFIAPIASEAGERAEREAGLEKIRAMANLDPTQPGAREAMIDALWAIGLFNAGYDEGRAAVLKLLAEMERDLASFSASQQRAVLSAAYTYYPMESAPFIQRLLPALSTPRQFAIGAYALLKSDSSPAMRQWLSAMWRWRFPDQGVGDQQEPRLIALERALTTDASEVIRGRPPLADLLAAPMRAAAPVVYSFQRRDRREIGLVMVRAADGRFVREPDGSYFHRPQLAMALTDLPGTITNGNTPQGLFTIVGAGTATNKWIGPTPYLYSKVPVEATVAEFAHADDSTPWSEAVYESFLPPTWRAYQPFKEAYLAGRAGRDEMLLHGTTVSHAYYQGMRYAPYSPSAGCLVSLETWSPLDGRLVRSDQLALAKAFTRDGSDRGYLVVVELDDRREQVTLDDVLPDVIAAELAAVRR